MAEVFSCKKGIAKSALTKGSSSSKNSLVWIDLKHPSDDDLEILKESLKLHPTTIQDLKFHNTRAKIEEFSNYLSVVLYDIYKEGDAIKPMEIYIVIGNNFIVTAYNGEISELEDLKKNNKELLMLMKEGSDGMLHYLMDIVRSHYTPIITELDDEIEDIETAASMHIKKSVLNRILGIRRRIHLIRKLIHPQLEKISFLIERKNVFIREEKIPYLRAVYDDIFQINQSIENAIEDISRVYDMYMSTISYNSNDVMKILSIAASIILPLSFIAGLFGMNVPHMPWTQGKYGFWILIGLMAVVASLMIIFFKRQKWL